MEKYIVEFTHLLLPSKGLTEIPARRVHVDDKKETILYQKAKTDHLITLKLIKVIEISTKFLRTEQDREISSSYTHLRVAITRDNHDCENKQQHLHGDLSLLVH